MSDSESEHKTAQLAPEMRGMKIEESARDGVGSPAAVVVKVEEPATRTLTPLHIPPKTKSRPTTQSPTKPTSASQHSSPGDLPLQEVVGGEISIKMEPGKQPKLSRSASHKVVAHKPPLFLDLPDSTEDAKDTFSVLPECTYANKHLGSTDHALECDCSEEWDPVDRINRACDGDSDCINRATKMECVGDCGCGSACQNQRFSRKQYANVTVIKTDKKGYGLRANSSLKTGDFIFEYIGEVINEVVFRRRMVQYDQEGIKHFYFMSLTKGEFVDATKKGNLGRFCNHSCNPNCFVDKWVVGDKLRMGIFAERDIKAGEELTFNYNVDRYGADPQPCYCGEFNCTGYIGGRTQTDNATKLSHATIEALGIDDGDGWDTAVSKKPRKKKASEDDEEYVNELQPKCLEESGVTKVMAALRQCTEKWIAVKLLDRIQRAEDEKVGHRVIRMHGYEIFKSTITAWIEDFNVVLQVLDILDKLPRITRNKIQDSKIEEPIEKLKSCGDERVEAKAAKLLDAWSKLEVAYRIPRMKRDPNAGTPVRAENHFERRERGRERSRTRSKSPVLDAPKGPSSAPSGPRGFVAQNSRGFFGGARPHRPRPSAFNALPQGWFQAQSETGSTYYYNLQGITQWQRPSAPASQPPAPPSKAKTNDQKLQDIISSITKNPTPTYQASASATPQPADEPKSEKKSKGEKWKALPQEKQEKIYENTIFPHVRSVTDQYRKRLEKDDLKRLAKEVSKKLVRGDYKANRVQDPTAKISSRHEKSIKKYVKEYMDKAVSKKAARDKEKKAKAEKKAKDVAAGKAPATEDSPETPREDAKLSKDDSDVDMPGVSDDEDEDSPGLTKRKREGDEQFGSPKKSRTEVPPAPPPPPPPPPAEDMPLDMDDSFEVDTNGSGVHMQDLPLGLVRGEPFIKGEAMYSPMQLATPPTTTNGSCEHESNVKDSSLEPASTTSDKTPLISADCNN
ncbi:hypothetical protein P154DRAFT_110378 [Amniculicola lignicola CBS 123094]|uniref:Histone-lysine N-methyltransferase, H3 lysine-36 specific n=1 Tax=Amniculicola lignicola CBS 123094 TaxID=1392246 RepID=A0A6A5WM71_9PLEO|nr:hypothetical protein P154DRAFT_110378 [Amniculicola lignicola CBS 123094]